MRIEHVPPPDYLKSTAGLIEVSPPELRVGDKILACRNEYSEKWMIWSGPYIIAKIGPVEPKTGYTSHELIFTTGETDHRFSDQICLVFRAGAVSQPKSSAWNGTCKQCGKGTYIGAGFLPVEHEDGKCPKA